MGKSFSLCSKKKFKKNHSLSLSLSLLHLQMNFIKLNFNLRNLIFSYLSTLDQIHISLTNKNFHSFIHKFNASLTNKNTMKIFSFLFNLRNIKNQIHRYRKHYINYYRDSCLFSNCLKRYSEFPLEDIVNGLVVYLNYYREEFCKNKIKLDFNQFKDKKFITLVNNIVRKLDKEKFVYFFEFDYINDFLHLFLDPEFLEIFLNIKNVKDYFYSKYKIVRETLHERNIKVYFERIRDQIWFSYPVDVYTYLQKTHNKESIKFIIFYDYLKSLDLDNLLNLIKECELCECPNLKTRKFIYLFDEKSKNFDTNNSENKILFLKKFQKKGDVFIHFFSYNNFKKIKKLLNSKIDNKIEYVSYFKKFEENVRKMYFKFNLKPNFKYFELAVFKNLQKLQIFYPPYSKKVFAFDKFLQVTILTF
jgi:hypothetical protein